MDRMRPIYVRQKSGGNNAAGPPTSPMMSPMHHHGRSGSLGMVGAKKAQHTKAAAQRLAHVMAHKPTDDDDEEDDDLSYDLGILSTSTGSIGLAGGRSSVRPRSPMSVRTVQDYQPTSTRTALGGRSSMPEQPTSTHSTPASSRAFQSDQQPSSTHSTPATTRPFQSINTKSNHSLRDQPYSLRSSVNARSASAQQLSSSNVEQPTSARSGIANRSPQPSNFVEQPNSARSLSAAARPQLGTNKPVHMVPASVPILLRPAASFTDPPLDNRRDPVPPISLRPPSTSNLSEAASTENQRDKRMSMDLGTFNMRESRTQLSFASALQDELRLAEERFDETEARAKQLEQQVANLGEGVTMEARLLSRKEAALHQREAALREAAQTQSGSAHGGRNDEAEYELKSLRIVTQRMILTCEEMEEVVLKRSWLARYWSLCIEHGIHAEIATSRYGFWSSLAPLPIEAVLAAGEKAKEEKEHNDLDEDSPRHVNELSGERSIESMLLVEKGMRELASLKRRQWRLMAHQRRPSSMKTSIQDIKLPIDGKFEGFELSKEESEDVFFKQAWLAYSWRRAKTRGLEPDIADERLRFWISHNSKSPVTSHDAVDVERGLLELRKLGIETQLWKESRKWLEHESMPNTQSLTDF